MSRQMDLLHLLRSIALPVAWVVLALGLGPALGSGPAAAATFYVAEDGDDTGAGTLDDPFATFARAAEAMEPGDTTFVRGGTYNESIVPEGSGEPDLPLTWARYEDEEPVITDVGRCIELGFSSHVVIDGFTCDGMAIEPDATVNVGVKISGGSYNEIRNSTFRNINDFGVVIAHGHDHVIRDNTFKYIGSTDLNGGRAVNLREGATKNLVAGNDMSYAGHNLVQIVHTSYNIVRGNRFTNPWWRGVGIVGDHARRNVVEDNEVFEGDVPDGYSGEPPPGLQLRGPQNLIRRNLLYENVGWGMRATASDFASHVDRNRIIHNVFYRNELGGWLHRDCCDFVGTTDSNAFANNIAFENGIAPEPLPDPSVQVHIRLNDDPLNDNWVFHNLIQDDQTGESVIKVKDINQAPLSWWEENYPEHFWGNVEGDPRFADASGGDFSLRPNSPAVDRGSFLTFTAAADSGQELVVEDASFFSDGYDLVPGDWIQLEGGEDAVVCRVDYFSNTLTLDRSLSWSAGEGVALAYEGTAPDMGAVERNLGTPPEPSCPSLPALPACSDRIDNDGDGLTDYPADPGCKDETSSTESPACDDEFDNDGDGEIDWDGGVNGADPDSDCSDAWRDSESSSSGSCGLGVELVLIVPLLGAGLRRAQRRMPTG